MSVMFCIGCDWRDEDGEGKGKDDWFVRAAVVGIGWRVCSGQQKLQAKALVRLAFS